uniref:Family with sequence similarity 47 member E n=1 Tax=Oryctolagus cuniculus TaxID=9986 RepID=A0A5F9CIZ8_RABIT
MSRWPGCSAKPRAQRGPPDSLNSRSWVFVRSGWDDVGQGCPRGRRSALPRPLGELSAPGFIARFPRPVRPERQPGLPRAVEAPPGPPHPVGSLRESREAPCLAELLLKVLHVLDPDRKLEDTWAYCEDTGKSAEEPRKLFTKRCTGVPSGRPKETPVSHSGQWPCEEKASEMDLLRDNGPLLQDNARKGVSDFCSWLAAVNPHRPKWVKMRYGAWYLNTKLWRKQRADEPLVDPKVLRQAQDESSRRKLRAQVCACA